MGLMMVADDVMKNIKKAAFNVISCLTFSINTQLPLFIPEPALAQAQGYHPLLLHN
jgi:hypothetical protein